MSATPPPQDIADMVATAPCGPDAVSRPGLAAIATCMATSRAIRRFRSDPVDPALVRLVLRLATTAGSGANLQPWRFVVVTDASGRKAVGEWYRRGWAEYARRGMSHLPEDASAVRRRSVASAQHLAEHFEVAPVLVVPCLRIHPRHPVDFFAGASLFPAVQNLMLAARAVGLGTTLTSMQALSGVDDTGQPAGQPEFLDELRAILDIPAEALPAAVLPLGWPDESFGATSRKPVDEVTYGERWGEPWAP
jgi:nitroreductase